MIRKSAAIATIVVVIIVIAISITKVNAQPMQVEVLDQQNVVQDVFDADTVCVVDVSLVNDVSTDVDSMEVNVPTVVSAVLSPVTVNDVSLVTVDSFVVGNDFVVGVVAV